jgi:glycogen debranching enzyme
MSYHNGSIWPHDNSLIVAGLARYGCHAEAATVAGQLFDAASHFSYYRLPELYCGFPRDESYYAGPAEYPVSCSPQAWAAAAPILLLQSMLNLQPRAGGQGVAANPHLPPWLNHIRLENLQVGARRLVVEVRRAADGITTEQHGMEETV